MKLHVMGSLLWLQWHVIMCHQKGSIWSLYCCWCSQLPGFQSESRSTCWESALETALTNSHIYEGCGQGVLTIGTIALLGLA